MEEGKRSISWLLAKINLGLTSLLFLIVLGWLIFSLVMNRVHVMKQEFWLLQLFYSIIGIYLLVPIFIGTLIGFFEFIFKKKKAAKKGFYINLVLLLYWYGFVLFVFYIH